MRAHHRLLENLKYLSLVYTSHDEFNCILIKKYNKKEKKRNFDLQKKNPLLYKDKIQDIKCSIKFGIYGVVINFCIIFQTCDIAV